MPLPNDADSFDPARHRRRTWGGGGLLAMAAACLSVLAIRYRIPFSGLAALVVTFLGSGWLAVRVLRGRWTRFGE
jgi:hypothetical protein